MPELPEVETICRGLAPVLVGQKIKRVEQRRANLRFPFPKNFKTRLQGEHAKALRRRAKYLLADLSSGETLIMHLGMSGRMTVTEERVPKARQQKPRRAKNGKAHDPQRHDHVVFHLNHGRGAKGSTLTYNDPRRFGFMLLTPTEAIDTHPLFAKLGPEPLGNEFSAKTLAAKAAGRRCDLKALLMDQRIVAGLGNIYVCEALHRAGISPFRRASTLTLKSGKPAARTHDLVMAIRDCLNDAIASGGSSLRDYRHADGAMGYFQHTFAVYDREGAPCPTKTCKGRIKRKVTAGRSTFYCPSCQR